MRARRLTLGIKSLIGDLFPKTTATFFGGAHVSVLGGKVTFEEPCTEFRTKLIVRVRNIVFKI